ncbi:6-bladed beta-propeller [Cytophagaceae bacterium YF14B1]|uniref:6-bladed beta-propeller n=1 Tax=Xanthocytophaga flava TaxID=3048013 RepID=A0AAE3QZT4_9BACT|nr:6-bladed beta-propeller [Xanthocytophaga flavus]MDJ1485739.1 6-bladed beta-propeller [Xanthocytophaga flavus]
MIKTLPRVILFLLLFIGFTSEVWAQQYTFKRTVGSVAINRPNDITVDGDGYIYVSSYENGIAKLNPAGELVFFKSLKEGFVTRDITLDRQGNLWAITDYDSRVKKFDSKGNVVFGFGAASASGSGNGYFKNPIGISVDPKGNVWVADAGNNRVQKFDPTGKFLLTFGSQGSGDGQFTTMNDLSADNQGNIWVVDKGNNRLQKFDSNGNFLLKIGAYGSANGQFNSPEDVKIDNQGNVWVADKDNYRIQKFDSTGRFLSKFGAQGGNFDQLSSPGNICLDKQNNLYILDGSLGIKKYDPTMHLLQTFPFLSSDNGKFALPADVQVDSQGNVWVVDRGNFRVQKFDSNGKFLLKVGGYGTTNGLFDTPGNIAVDNLGNLWVIDGGTYRVQKFNANGTFLLKFGSQGTSNGQFVDLRDIATDKQGNVWIWDAGNGRIQKFNSSGKFLLSFGSLGAGDSEFSNSSFISTDLNGNLWVMDSGNSSLKKFDSTGKFLFKVGMQGSGNGQFYNPIDITADVQGNIWIGDRDNNRFQRFDSNGKFLSQTDSPNVIPLYFCFDSYGAMYCTTMAGVLVYTPNSSVNPIYSFIKGRIYSDLNQNCTFDGTDKPVSDVVVLANPGSYYGITDKNGNYRIAVDTGSYTVSQVLNNTIGSVLHPICPANNISSLVSIKTKGDSISNINFGNTVTAIPHLDIAVSSDRRRRCFSSQTVVTFSNTGYADAQGVKVYVKMPENVILQTADKPFTITPDSSYVFSIGTLGANQTSTIQITDSVACIADITGLTACTKVWITPANDYTLPESSTWDKSDIMLTGKCVENGRVQMVIKNIGHAMADSAEFRILLNAQLALRKNYKLEAGDSLVLRIPANGKTVRLEANQRPDHPRKSQTNLTIEGCVASTSDVVSKGFVDALPQDDAEPEVAVECLPIIDSFDPNDKLVSPVGTSKDHYTPTNTELKYTIRFQNTGTDYAYTVTVVDTLSESLDISTLQMGSSSHMYSLKVTGKGRPVLTWKFNTINLPDSTRDQAGSNGFVQFTIKPKANLAEKALIENFADIFFDYNDPVRTNTTANVLYDVPPVIAPQNQLSEKGVIFLPPTISSFTPETAQIGEQITITGTNYQTILTDNTVTINGKKATVVSATETQLVVTIPTGVTAGKVSVTTLGGTATSETEFVMKPTATEQPEWSRSIVISPNPSDGRFTIDFSQASTRIETIDVYNNLGQKIYTQAVSQSSYQKELDLSGNGVGIYLVVFKTDKGNATRKVIVK